MSIRPWAQLQEPEREPIAFDISTTVLVPTYVWKREPGPKTEQGWGLLWHSENATDGLRENLMWHSGEPLFFYTREEAREYKRAQYGYIANRPDLQREPHGWKMPQVVKVTRTLILNEGWSR